MTETRRLKNVVIFIQTILSFALSKKKNTIRFYKKKSFTFLIILKLSIVMLTQISIFNWDFLTFWFSIDFRKIANVSPCFKYLHFINIDFVMNASLLNFIYYWISQISLHHRILWVQNNNGEWSVKKSQQSVVFTRF